MTKIPEAENSIAEMIDAAIEARAEPPRPHLGCSQIGHTCDRWLWLSFRWAVTEQFSGRMLRLFRRGQNEEAVTVSDLRSIGLDVQATGANQSRVDFGTHFSGSLDGIVTGLPGCGAERHVLEIKTHSDKSFRALTKDGVRKSKPLHFAQMQTYMLGRDLEHALYVAVNKNDDSIYTERVKLDKPFAERLVKRAHRITMAERMPEGISTDPSWYECKFCPAHGVVCFNEEYIK